MSRGDLAGLVAAFGAALHDAGLPVGPDRSERFARAVTLLAPTTTAELHRCARATLTCHPEQFEILDRVFDAVFRGYADDPADFRGDPNATGTSTTSASSGSTPSAGPPPPARRPPAGRSRSRSPPSAARPNASRRGTSPP
ncbi:hypothetical protein [Dactylosporangium cerinum]